MSGHIVREKRIDLGGIYIDSLSTSPIGNVQYPMFLTRASIRLLRKEVSPSFYHSLENIWDMMKTEVFTPLSLARNEKDFLGRVKKVLPQFSRLRIAMIAVFMSYYTENLKKLQDDMVKIFSQLEKDTERRGKKYMGVVDRLYLKSILHTASGVSRRALQWVINQASPEEVTTKIIESEEVLNLFTTTTQLELLLIFVFSILEGEIEPIKPYLIKTALNEANSYANKYFYYAKKLEILAPPERVKVSFPEKLSEEEIKEDRELTEAGLKNYIHLLKREDSEET